MRAQKTTLYATASVKREMTSAFWSQGTVMIVKMRMRKQVLDNDRKMLMAQLHVPSVCNDVFFR